jgi:SM-20-related protein
LPDHLGPLPPFAQILDFLPPQLCRHLLEWAIANESLFARATVTRGRKDSAGRIDPQKRIALVAKVSGEIRASLLAHFEQALPEVMKATGTTGTPPAIIELQMAAHPDGAHFAPHLDIPIGADRKPLAGADGHDRVISAVYYFHAEPRAFTGGELRLYRFGTTVETLGKDPANYVDIAPINNSLVAFPSWAQHEVRPVRCPSQQFRDYRFAINCWYCKILGRPQ